MLPHVFPTGKAQNTEHMATCRISLSSCRNVEHDFHNDSKMAAEYPQTAAMPPPLCPETDRCSYTNQPPTWQPHAFRQLLCHPFCAQKQIESSYTNQPPTWQPHAFGQLPPGPRKPSKEHFLMFHRCSTELFRGWTCLLDFCKHLANMGLWKIVNV